MALISAVASALRGGHKPELDPGPSPTDRPTAPAGTHETSQAGPNSAS